MLFELPKREDLTQEQKNLIGIDLESPDRK
jgi:hypothetical protein